MSDEDRVRALAERLADMETPGIIERQLRAFITEHDRAQAEEITVLEADNDLAKRGMDGWRERSEQAEAKLAAQAEEIARLKTKVSEAEAVMKSTTERALNQMEEAVATMDAQRKRAEQAEAKLAEEFERRQGLLDKLAEALAAMSSDGADAIGHNAVLRTERDEARTLCRRLADNLDGSAGMAEAIADFDRISKDWK